MTTTELLADIRSTGDAIRSQDWVSAGIGGASTGLDMLGATASPLSAITSAGFGIVTELVSFLEEPLGQLRGDPGSVTASAADMHGTGQKVSSLADSYGQSASTETPGWSGGAASGYQESASKLVDGIIALGEAGIAVGEAVSKAGELVAKVSKDVTELITEASGKIITIMNQALAAAQATFGMSIAEAIPHCVQIAGEYAGKIGEKLGALLGSSTNLLALLKSALSAVKVVKAAITQISQQATATKGKESKPSEQAVTSGRDLAHSVPDGVPAG